MQAILDAIDAGDLPATVVGCVSDRPGAGALDRARRRDCSTAVRPPANYDTPESFGEALCDTLADWEANFIALAGYLKKIPAPVLHAYPNRITNIHPSLLPAFGGAGMYGTRVHEAVLASGVHWTGVTVHLVNDAYDDGPIVAQQPVPVLPGDSVDALQQRVLAVEHQLYPAVLRQFARDRIRVEGRTVTVTDDSLSHPTAPAHAQPHD